MASRGGEPKRVVRIPPELVGHFIGANGWRIQKLMTDTNSKIKIGKVKGVYGYKCTITGQRESIQRAVAEIDKFFNEFAPHQTSGSTAPVHEVAKESKEANGLTVVVLANQPKVGLMQFKQLINKNTSAPADVSVTLTVPGEGTFDCKAGHREGTLVCLKCGAQLQEGKVLRKVLADHILYCPDKWIGGKKH